MLRDLIVFGGGFSAGAIVAAYVLGLALRFGWLR